MIRGRLWELVDKTQMEQLHQAAVRLLGRTGARIEHESVLDMLEEAGCRTERSAQRCMFTERLIQDAVEHFGDPDRRPSRDYVGPTRWGPAWHQGHGGSYPHLLEWPDCKRRLATRQDVADMAKMCHTLPELETCGQVLTCAQVDGRVEPVWNVVERMSITDKPIAGGEVLHYQNIKHLVRLGELLTGQPGANHLVASCNFSVAPLIFGRRVLECILEKAKHRCAHVPGTMPISGLSAPATIAGTVAVCLAELIGGWVIAYLIDPTLPAGGIVASGSLDMHTLRACFGSPEAHLQDVATAQVCRDLYGIDIHPALGYIDCKTPGIEATYEKLFTLVAWPFVGTCGIGAGLLSAGQDYSPVQHILDAEMLKSFERFSAGFAVDEDSLAVSLIDRVATQKGATFLDTDHTLARYAGEQWYPRFLDRRIWQGDVVEAQSERRMLDQIDRYWRDAVARYEPPEMDEGRLAEARRILAAAEAEVL